MFSKTLKRVCVRVCVITVLPILILFSIARRADFMNKIHQTEFMEKFNDSIIDIPVEDMYYLLQTFSSIALAREKSDWDFIQRITLDLFKVGFYKY